MEHKERLVKGGMAFGYPVSSLRTEAKKGNLALTRVGGKDWVTEKSVRDMERKCQIHANPPAYGYVKETTEARQHGISLELANQLPQDALRLKLTRLMKPSKHISQNTTKSTRENVISMQSIART
jgi:hypothetical protein